MRYVVALMMLATSMAYADDDLDLVAPGGGVSDPLRLSLGLSLGLTGSPYASADRLHVRGSNSANTKYSLYLESLDATQSLAWDNGGNLTFTGTGARILFPGTFIVQKGIVYFGNAQSQGAVVFPSTSAGIFAFWPGNTAASTGQGIGFNFTSAGVQIQSGGVIRSGAGAPEAAVVGSVGDIYLRTGGGAGTSFYVKESGTGNTGWTGK